MKILVILILTTEKLCYEKLLSKHVNPIKWEYNQFKLIKIKILYFLRVQVYFLSPDSFKNV